MSRSTTPMRRAGRSIATLMALLLGLGMLVVGLAGPAQAAVTGPTATTVRVSPSSLAFGSASSITVIVRDRGNHAVRGSTIITIDGKPLPRVFLDKTGAGAAKISTTTGVGRHSIKAVYYPAAGASTLTSSGSATFVVNKATVTTTATVPASVTYGSTTTVRAHFSGHRVTPAVAKLVTASSRVIATANVDPWDNVSFKFATSWNAGGQPLSIKYGGNSYNVATSKSINLKTVKANTTLKVNAPAALAFHTSSSLKVSASSSGTPSGNVALVVDGTTRSSAKLSNGGATLTIPALAAGTHTLKVSYYGDANHNSASSSFTRAAASSQCPVTARACVDLAHNLAWLQSGGKVTYGPVPMLSGRPGYRTPSGMFQAYWHDIDHRSSEFNGAPMPYSVFFVGGVAFHEGSLSVESHGCIHLSHDAAMTFYNSINDGDNVYVFGYAPY